MYSYLARRAPNIQNFYIFFWGGGGREAIHRSIARNFPLYVPECEHADTDVGEDKVLHQEVDQLKQLRIKLSYHLN